MNNSCKPKPSPLSVRTGTRTPWFLLLLPLTASLAVQTQASTFSDAQWCKLGPGVGVGPDSTDSVRALAVSGTNLYVGGQFDTVGGMPAPGIAMWNGHDWCTLGSGMSGGYYRPSVSALAVKGTTLYAGGNFTAAGGVPANNIARWDGSSWSALADGLTGGIYYPKVTVLAVAGTNLYAGGCCEGGIAKWDGTSWSPLGTGVSGGTGVYALAASGTTLFVGGYFTTAGGAPANFIAQWDGKTWSSLGSGMNNTVATLVLVGQNLYAGGWFTTAGGVEVNHIAKWDGSTWSSVAASPGLFVNALTMLGPYLCAGSSAIDASSIGRWDGSAWSNFGSGVNNAVFALAADDVGHLFVGGAFTLAGTNPCMHIAQANVATVPAFVRQLQPRTQTAEVGTTANFAAGVCSGELTCQWFFHGTNLVASGESRCLELTNLSLAQSGAYTLVLTNFLGSATSAPALLNVIPAVPRQAVPRLKLTGGAGAELNVEGSDSLGGDSMWQWLATVTLTNTTQDWFDVAVPPRSQRFYRASQTGPPAVAPSLELRVIPALLLAGNIGDSLRVDAIEQFGPTNAWFTLDTVTLTNSSQLYLDPSALGQPQRLYRWVRAP